MNSVFKVLCLSAFMYAVAARSQNGPLSMIASGDLNPVQGITGRAQLYTHCDARGNMYIAVEQPQHYDHRPVLYRIAPNGYIQATFTAPSVAGNGGIISEAFAQNGSVAMLEVARASEYLLRFGPHGEFLSRTPMRWRSQGGRIGLFPDGKLLITYHNHGMVKNGQNIEFHQGTNEMHTGVYDSNGNLIKEVKLPNDDAIQQAVRNHDSRFAIGHEGSNAAVDLSEVVSGTDDNVYLLRGHTNPAIVYVIDSTGTLIRTLQIAAPLPTMMPGRLQADKGLVSLQFYDPATSKRMVSVNDWNTGALLRLYDLSGIGGTFACFKAETERLTFVGSTGQDHQVVIGFAHPATTTAQSQTP